MKIVNVEFSERIPNILLELQQEYIDPNIFSKRAILALRNEEVDAINQLVIAKFLGKAITYNSFDSVGGEDATNYPQEFLHTLCPPNISPTNSY